MKEVDIEHWNRKEHFQFFSKMASPFFGIVTEVDCTAAYRKVKELNIPFFAFYLHRSMMAVNRTEAFRYRIIDGRVYIFDIVHAAATAARDDDTFAFIFVRFSENFEEFNRELQREFEEVRHSTGLRLNGDHTKKDLIRHSVLPWTHFTALLHPTNLDPNESVPKITFGKFTEREGRKYLPVSVEAHHGLMDGLHISKYLNEFQQLLNE
jgi:chloramphenicol O-acetyltransferase type A